MAHDWSMLSGELNPVSKRQEVVCRLLHRRRHKVVTDIDPSSGVACTVAYCPTHHMVLDVSYERKGVDRED